MGGAGPRGTGQADRAFRNSPRSIGGIDTGLLVLADRNIDQSAELAAQIRNVRHDRFPHDLQVDVPILVTQDIAHATHLVPRDFRMLCNERGMFVLQQPRGLGDVLKVIAPRKFRRRIQTGTASSST